MEYSSRRDERKKRWLAVEERHKRERHAGERQEHEHLPRLPRVSLAALEERRSADQDDKVWRFRGSKHVQQTLGVLCLAERDARQRRWLFFLMGRKNELDISAIKTGRRERHECKKQDGGW